MISRESILATYTVAVDIQVTQVMNYAEENFYKNGLVIVYSVPSLGWLTCEWIYFMRYTHGFVVFSYIFVK